MRSAPSREALDYGFNHNMPCLTSQAHWLQESRYRQRYLDTIVNGHVRDIFVTRARIMRFLRSYFDERGFLEVRICHLHVLQVSLSLKRPAWHVVAFVDS